MLDENKMHKPKKKVGRAAKPAFRNELDNVDKVIAANGRSQANLSLFATSPIPPLPSTATFSPFYTRDSRGFANTTLFY